MPTKTRELAVHAVEELVTLAAIKQTAPPPIAELLEDVGMTMTRMAMYLHASLDEGGECVMRIEERAEGIYKKTVEASKQLRDMEGHAARAQTMRSIFSEQPRRPIGFRHDASDVS